MHFCTACGTPLPKTASLASERAELRPPVPPPHHRSATAAAADDLVGQTLDDKYQILARIGSGGMGTVYKARRLHIDDIIAVKVLHKELVGEHYAIERFRREARAAARLKHINAVAIYDSVVSPGGAVYMAMEMVEGRSLGTLIKELGFLPPRYAAAIFTQVCSAVDEAHRQHIVHRDLKPDNILVDTTKREPEVKVLDFGIAKLRDVPSDSGALTQQGVLLGTPMYMSPEQCMGEEIDGRSDIYSLGVILYEMLTGMAPFESPTPTAVIVQHVTKAPTPLREINSSIPPGVEKVVLHALQKRKEDRPQTASALAQEFLASVNSSTPVRAGVTESRVSDLTTRTDVRALTQGQALPERPGPQTLGQRSGSPVPITEEFLAGEKPQSRRGPLLFLLLLAGVLLLASAFLLARIVTTLDSDTANAVPPEATEEPRPRVPTPAPEPPAPETPAPPPRPPVDMAYVSGGEFMIGREGGAPDEGPPQRVLIQPYFIDTYEVTCAEYQKFVEATGHPAPTTWQGSKHPSGWARRPVTGVSWEDANAYASWAGKRLPTEAEWEFAARGSDGRLYPWGNQWKARAANAHTTSHRHPDGVGTHRAGASPVGAYDMVGNAWEWTASNLEAYPGGTLSVGADGGMKVVRGGSYESDAKEATTTFRKGLPPTGSDYYNVGIRCVKDV